jgi:hypothetical protein
MDEPKIIKISGGKKESNPHTKKITIKKEKKELYDYCKVPKKHIELFLGAWLRWYNVTPSNLSPGGFLIHFNRATGIATLNSPRNNEKNLISVSDPNFTFLCSKSGYHYQALCYLTQQEDHLKCLIDKYDDLIVTNNLY